ncbi:putative enterotoxin [Ophiocordyceps camponoti-floridani]|uniref:Putative enterotoxin n=1 Tax=Ophiocordyceps camponoti-floridani TaxID=2030778 RepID=A0A8H4Q0E1_9HYPO|nr:putative enterotoxin [Ophiocordyceps camponoti-floridani]
MKRLLSFVALFSPPGHSQLSPRGVGSSKLSPAEELIPAPPNLGLESWDLRPVGLPDLQDESPRFVLRGEYGRSPADVRRAGGLYARGRYGSPEKGIEDVACNLVYHVQGRSAPFTKFVSTTTSKEMAMIFASNNLELPGEWSRYGTIYMIAADSKMINAIKSIPTDKYPSWYKNQKEFSVAGGVPMSQIKGWFVPKYMNGREIHWGFIFNADFDTAHLENLKDGGAQPQLAGPVEGSKERLESYVKDVVFKGDEGEFRRFWYPENDRGASAAPGACAGLGKRDNEACNQDDATESSKNGDETKGFSSDIGADGGDKTVADNPGRDFELSAEAIARKEFETLAIKFGITDLVWHKSAKTKISFLHQLFTGFRGYGKVSTISRPKMRSLRLSSGVLAVAGLGLYVKSVVDEFSQDTSALDRAAVVTSILPFVGCGLQAVAAQKHGILNIWDTALCVVGDALLLSPAWPVWFLVQGLRYLIGAVTSVLSPRQVRVRRDEAWQAYLRKARNYLQSDNFTSDIETHFKVEMAAVLFAAAEAHGKLIAGRDLFLVNASHQRRLTVIERTLETRIGVQGDMCEAIVKKMAELQRDLPIILKRSMREDSEKLNDRFVAQYRPASYYAANSIKLFSTYIRSVHPIPQRHIVSAARLAGDRIRSVLEKVYGDSPCKVGALGELASDDAAYKKWLQLHRDGAIEQERDINQSLKILK